MTKLRLPEDQGCLLLRAGRLELHVAVTPSTVKYSAAYAETAAPKTTLTAMKRPPEGLEWKAEAFKPNDGLFASKSLATEPYVIDLAEGFSVRPFDAVEGFIFLPPTVRVFDGRGRVVFRVPTVPPKDAWYGDVREGVPGFAVRSRFDFSTASEFARKTGEELARPPNRPEPRRADDIACPVTVRNEMSTPYELQRLCLPTDGLALYDAGGTLVCDRLVVTNRDDGIGVDLRQGLDPAFGDFEVVDKARTSPEARFFRSGISLFLKLAGR